ncbi:MAG: hypothetical protein ACK55X_14825 [Synechococcaceae cyanobacterium]|jgi:hypothetical protein
MADATTRIGVKQAVASAMDFVRDMYDGQSLRDLLLEEVEMTQADNQWLVTIGFSLAGEESASILSPATRKPARHYKVIAVDALSGHPLSMKMRED